MRMFAHRLRTRSAAMQQVLEQQLRYEHLERELERQGFFSSPDKRPSVVNNLRTMFLRAEPTGQEVKTLRGIVATLVKAKGGGPK